MDKTLEKLVAKSAITRLMYDYCAAVDEGRLADMARMFERGTWQVGGRRECTGSAEILDYLTENLILFDGVPATRHVTANVRVDISDDLKHANASSYLILFQSVPGTPPEIINQASYRDTFELDDAGAWYFVSRVVKVDGRGNMANHFREAVGEK